MERLSNETQETAAKSSVSPTSLRPLSMHGNRDSLAAEQTQPQTLPHPPSAAAAPPPLGNAHLFSTGPVQAKKKKGESNQQVAPLPKQAEPMAPLRERTELNKLTRTEIAGDKENQLSYLDNLDANFDAAQQEGGTAHLDLLLDAAAFYCAASEPSTSLGVNPELAADGGEALLANPVASSDEFTQYAMNRVSAAQKKFGAQVRVIGMLEENGKEEGGPEGKKSAGSQPSWAWSCGAIQNLPTQFRRLWA